MKADYTLITVILDRTGSMEEIRDDTIGGFNAFLRDQKSEEGTATITLVQFDSQDPYEVIYRFAPIQEAQDLDRATYVPRASTPLLDAIGRGINDLEQSLSKMNEDDRPERVVFAIITDGQENASTEFKKAQIEQMIKARKELNDWQFLFLSADLCAINDAVAYGVDRRATVHFDKTGHDTREVFVTFSEEVSNYRKAKKKKMGFGPKADDSPNDRK